MSDIVYVDDVPEEFLAKAETIRKRILDFEFDDGRGIEKAFGVADTAVLWLFDFYLIHPDRAGYSDENGLSLLPKWTSELGGRPTTVVVSNDLGKALKEPLGREERRHVIAQKHGVEWLGPKTKDTADRIKQLADASLNIAESLILTDSSEANLGIVDLSNLCFDVLRVPSGSEWANSAMRHIDRSRPPREVSNKSAAMKAQAVVSWLLVHVLPFPSFLLTDRQAALRLQMTPESFRRLIQVVEESKSRDALQEKLAASKYEGPLSNFLGPRWWRAGIDDFAWHLSKEAEGFRPALEAFAETAAVDWLTQSEPVLVSDADLIETDEIAEARDCVRVTDEDFPAGIEPAWVRVDAARDDRKLRAKVVYEDRELLEVEE
ncbi:hypothetical protein [Neorhizobium sp. T25_13]|uniref:hypothetical protein n=1 Tax=Neorhizobium sp. T25_13 TaxID=2093830 RepID=UPI000CF9DA62|nr:hypothetical protein [Neorhizobium sp. T25_13]